MHGCVVGNVAVDALVLKHQAISIHNPDYTFIVLDQFHMKILHLWWTTLENKITLWKIWPGRLSMKRNSSACTQAAILYIGFEIYTFKTIPHIHSLIKSSAN